MDQRAVDQDLERLELKIAKFLRLGVLVAGALMLFGWLASLARGGDTLGGLAIYAARPLAEDVRDARAIGDWGRLIIYLGLATLVALPFTRVCLTAVLFLRRREWVLAGVALFVSLALVASVVLGIDL